MAIELEEAQERVASLGEELDAAVEAESLATARAETLAAGASNVEQLLSDRLVAEQDAFSADQERLAATAEVENLREELDVAQAALEAAQSGAHSASFAPAAAELFGMPSRADGYVFPVGGGPGIVSVGHRHHDYPAADIAAPLGSPVYALADGIVLEPHRRRARAGSGSRSSRSTATSGSTAISRTATAASSRESS